MRNDYLIKPGSARFNASGVATAVLKPDQGQWWFPTFIRVSTVGQLTPPPQCTLYVGGLNVTTPDAFVDSTFLGNGDTSSIISGSVIQFGEAITAVWTGGTPNDTAILGVYGMVSDVPVSAGSLLPGIPGAHFVGRVPVTYDRVLLATSPTILTGGTFTTAVIDMRAYQGCMLSFLISTVTITPAAFNPARINVDWYMDAAGTDRVFNDSYEILALQIGGTFVCNNGKLNIQDIVHGPFLKVTVYMAGPDSITATIEINGTSRSFGTIYMEEIDGYPPDPTLVLWDGVLVNISQQSLAAAAVKNTSMRMAPGNVAIRMSTGTMPYSFTFHMGSLTEVEVFTLAASAVTRQNLIFPKRSVWVAAQNTGAGAGIYSLTIYREMKVL